MNNYCCRILVGHLPASPAVMIAAMLLPKTELAIETGEGLDYAVSI
jgi:hypothetical protein